MSQWVYDVWAVVGGICCILPVAALAMCLAFVWAMAWIEHQSKEKRRRNIYERRDDDTL